MRKILILTHGQWGEALVESLTMILGKIEGCDVIPLKPENTFSEYFELVSNYCNTIEEESLILTDLQGGTTSNVALKIGVERNMHVICGLNAPILIEGITQLKFNNGFDVEQLVKVANDSTIDLTDKYKRVHQEKNE